jgi:hypothetical protein
MAAALTGCAQPAYHYVSSKNQDVVLRVPRTWTQLSTNDVLKASGQDPSGLTGWLAFYDAHPTPAPANLTADTVDMPVLAAESLPISESRRDVVTLDFLRDTFRPVSAAEQAKEAQARLAAGLPPRSVKVVLEQPVKTANAVGLHLVYSITTYKATRAPAPAASASPGSAASPTAAPAAGATTGPAASPAAGATTGPAASPAPALTVDSVEFFDQIAVTDPKKTKLHLLLVHCSQQCYSKYVDQITDSVTSFTVKKR